MFRRLNHILAVGSVSCAVAFAAACEIRVRDSAFRSARDIHRLCIVAEASDDAAAKIETRLRQWLATTPGDVNLEVMRVAADDPDTNWRALGLPSAPPGLPVTVLVGRNNGSRESFLIDHWEPAPSDEQLASIVDSPLRHRLARELAENIAVLVFSPSNSDLPGNSDSSVVNVLRSIVQTRIAEERLGLSLIMLDRYAAEEQLLCRFIGLRPDGPDTLCVAFGRGKLMSPPLAGDEITAQNIEKLVAQIRQTCSCSKPLPTMGVDIPLLWPDEIDQAVVLLDQELSLSELDAEVQNMMAAKATGKTKSDAATIAIPPGRQAEAPHAGPGSIADWPAIILLGILLLCVVWIVFAFAWPRRSQTDSTI